MENENKQPEQEELNDEQLQEVAGGVTLSRTISTTTTVVSRGMTDLQQTLDIQALRARA